MINSLLFSEFIISLIMIRVDIMNRRGQALVEYILIIALISVIAIAIVNYFGGYLKDAITKTSCSLVGEEYIPGEKRGSGYCSGDKKKDKEEKKEVSD